MSDVEKSEEGGAKASAAVLSLSLLHEAKNEQDSFLQKEA